jgi:hypothetical protein
MTSPKKPGIAFWATVVVVVVLVAYPLSIGLSYRLLSLLSGDALSRAQDVYLAVYAPILWVYEHGPAPVHEAINFLCGCKG